MTLSVSGHVLAAHDCLITSADFEYHWVSKAMWYKRGTDNIIKMIKKQSIHSVLFAPLKTRVHVWLHLSKIEQNIDSKTQLIHLQMPSNINFNDIYLTIYPAIILGSNYLSYSIYCITYSLNRLSLRLAWENCIYLIELPVTEKQFRIWSCIPFIVRFTATEFETGFSSEGLTPLPRFLVMTFTVVTQYNFRPQWSTGVNPWNMIKTHPPPLDKKPSIVAHDIFKYTFLMKLIQLWFKFHWNFF